MKNKNLLNTVLLTVAAMLFVLLGAILAIPRLVGGPAANPLSTTDGTDVTNTSSAKPINTLPPTETLTSPTPVVSIIPVELPPADKTAVEENRILLLPWGSAPQAVGIPIMNQGPGGFDISPDGTIALLDGMNNRVLLYDTRTGIFNQCAVPQYAGQYIDIDERHWFTHVWRDSEDPTQVYMLIYNTACEVVTKAPVYVQDVDEITDDWEVYTGHQLMTVLNNDGAVLSQEEQRASLRPHGDLWVEAGESERFAILHDDRRELTFKLRLGEDTPVYRKRIKTGYVFVGFAAATDRSFYRVTWFDTAGTIVKDVRAPRPMWRSIFGTQIIAMEEGTGDIYLIGDTPQGVVIYRVSSP
jgi:hypothetical protein